MILGVIGVVMAGKYRLETRVIWGNFLLAVVGCGSFAFHATLLFETQMMDEVPIVYLLIIFFYMEFNMTQHTWWLSYMLVAYAICMTYSIINNPDNQLVFLVPNNSLTIYLLTR